MNACGTSDTSASASDLQPIIDALSAYFQNLPGVVIAYSGGVDSAVVAAAAHRVLGDRALAVTADSASLARSELSGAVLVARQIGVAHRIITTRETDDSAYQANDSQRCYYCKSHLFQALLTQPEVRDGWRIVTGTNQDDLGDWRPGLRAASEYGAQAPLAELGITKSAVRALALAWDLPVADKPASPCLASRLAYGLEVTPARLAMVEAAEAELRQMGLTAFRVRLHEGDLARIEVPLTELSRFTDPGVRQKLVHSLGQWGFKYVTLDLEGFSSGSLNKLILPSGHVSKPD